MTTVWADELVWESKDREFEIHRYRKLNGTQGHAIMIEQYECPEYSDTKSLRSFFECDERYYFLMAKAYLESIGLKVINPEEN